ncbi:Hypothetical protein PHPALM_18288 [Phytophthora palmivora]|uniref:Uncharacterized protein n=1 Tax=Phytophthora palmivora TaxID=4796 RepID=A0A2P4XK37_9STRA|nr:Hypothetical protein PHPALM_18288 [Phytophthora palmivora]
MALNRNFRTTYYKTLGVPVVQHIVDVEASFAALLVGTLPPYPGIWNFTLKERFGMFEDVVTAAQVLQAKDVTDGDEGRGKCYDFMELLVEEDGDQEKAPSSLQDLKRLVHLHRTYWREIAAWDAPLLCGMDDPNFLLGVARVVCEVLTHEAERFWCFSRMIELFHDGLELVDPVVTLDTLYNASLAEFEVVFLRTLDVKRRRSTADGSMSSLHLLKSGHDEEYGRRR